ncbi:MAG TPA: ABC transporter ATP-binding protein [Puia sp.]|nr:ABC transporter ATP-binding protein [Puia sp.]
MSDTVIKVENISKLYRLGEVGTGTISHDLNRWWAKVRGKEDPFAKLGESNDRSVKGNSDYAWALQDISFEVRKGEVLGVIGRNGAGKSTLLKILSKVTQPTKGQIKAKGRIASLLEVGTGFHPELTGRENIYLNGAILGMTKAEIRRKFDEIVDFAGISRYIDTPVKRYSSGMYVRLAFAVAAHLEPEILIVDEVLAVGDAEFQKKALGKMKDVSTQQGRTVLFVSHNMGAIQNLCDEVLILNKGGLSFLGGISEGIKHYLDHEFVEGLFEYKANAEDNKTCFSSIHVENGSGAIKGDFGFDEMIKVKMTLCVKENSLNAKVGFRVQDNMERRIFTSEMNISDLTNKPGELSVNVDIPSKILMPGKYSLTFAVHIPNIAMIELLNDIVCFEIQETGSSVYQYLGSDSGCVFVNCDWSLL